MQECPPALEVYLRTELPPDPRVQLRTVCAKFGSKYVCRNGDPLEGQ